MNEHGLGGAEQIARAAKALEGAERSAFLDRTCGDDLELREQVEALVEGKVVPGVDSVRLQLERHGLTATASAAGDHPWLPHKARYVLKGEVGRGGMGAVLKVFDTDLRRNLAMKVILGSQDDRGGAAAPTLPPHVIDRFLEEAQVTGQLEHPGVVPVHELGVDGDGRMYFTMRLVRGKDFEEIIRLAREESEGWNPQRALNTLLRICETVAYAHSRHVLHRDLKPANVMVGRFGETYVMDWGAARILQAESGDRTPSNPSGTFAIVRTDRHDQGLAGESPSATVEGSLIGTPYYMPREQAAGILDEIGPHSDVYAVGAILYHLLTGRRPYESPNRRMMEILAAIMSGPPPTVRDLAPDVPVELEAICEKAMAHDWAARYPTMLDMADDLRAYLEGRAVGAHDTGMLTHLQKWVGRNKALAITLAASTVLLLAALGSAVYIQSTKLSAVQAEQERTTAALSLAEENEQAALANAERAQREGYVASVIAADASLLAKETREAKRLLAQARSELRGWEWQHLSLKANSSLAILRGHDDDVLALAYHPGGGKLASSSLDGTVWIWDVAGGSGLFVLEDHEDTVSSLVFSGDGGRLHTFGGWADAKMRTWDSDSGELVGIMDLPAAPISPVALSPEETLLAFAVSGNAIQLVDATNGQALRTFAGHDDLVHELAFVPGTDRLLSASGDGRVRLWDTTQGTEIQTFQSGEEGGVFALAVRPDGTGFVTGAEDGTVREWTFGATGSRVIGRHDAVVYALSYSPDGSSVASVSFDKTVRIVDLEAERTMLLNGHDSPVRCLAFSPDGRRLTTGGEDSLILMWDVRRSEAVGVRNGPDEWVSSVALAPSGGVLALGSHFSGAIELVNRSTGETTTIPGGDDPVNAIAFSPDGERLAAGYEEEACVRIFAVAGHEEIHTLYGHEASVTSVDFSPDGRSVASGSTDYTVKLWSAETGEVLHDFTDGADGVRAVAFHPTKKLLAGAYADGRVVIWNLASGSESRRLEGHPEGAYALAWSPDGSELAVGAGDHSLWIWGAGTEAEAVLVAHDQRISSVAYSPDGARIVTGSYDTSLRIWDAGSRQPLLSLREHAAAITSVAFSPDGAEVISSSFDNTVRTWRTKTGLE